MLAIQTSMSINFLAEFGLQQPLINPHIQKLEWDTLQNMPWWVKFFYFYFATSQAESRANHILCKMAGCYSSQWFILFYFILSPIFFLPSSVSPQPQCCCHDHSRWHVSYPTWPSFTKMLGCFHGYPNLENVWFLFKKKSTFTFVRRQCNVIDLKQLF